jgi:hypothetical protein
MVNEFWPDSDYTLVPSGVGEWQPRSRSLKEPNGFKVLLEKGRYKFVLRIFPAVPEIT